MGRLRRLFWRLWPHRHDSFKKNGDRVFGYAIPSRLVEMGHPVHVNDLRWCCAKCGKILAVLVVLLLLASCRFTADNTANGGEKIESIFGCPTNPCAPACPATEKAP